MFLVIFSVKKPNLLSSDSYCKYLGLVENDIYDTNYSSYPIWYLNEKKSIKFSSSKNVYTDILFLLCGDINIHPGPAKCTCCRKSIKSTDIASCSHCKGKLHLKCLKAVYE